jgi:hypothetical protein
MDDDNNNKRGANFKLAEDLQICYAWIGTSEDATVGTNMKTADFKEKFHNRYATLIDKYNNDMKTDYCHRNSSGCYNRFKKISKGLLKYLGTENSVGSPPSGDTDKEKWNEKVQQLFLKRYPEFVKLLESIQACKDVLGDKPKWRAFQDEEEMDEGNSKKRSRPEGTKKAKEMKADRDCIQKFLSAGDEKKNKKKEEHMDKKEKFMTEVSNAIAVLTNNLDTQNDLKLLEMLSPESKRTMAKEMLTMKMATKRQQSLVDNSTPKEITIDNTETDESETSPNDSNESTITN